ncbi:pro-sigmaK processing inhibitor BofA family protein [Fredinandcohnia quinoae]|uniref:Pro-sigmaK processing inhibitor BofA family protein n=1 Tax=Fredinandcohnia quinoae TaxID=2918902 RepID=A0AAW5EG66_9BACI|nr:pro-sigmaK processing inhibitor BofA family protein [Fredinandcohnia sp. SECRCQ15]MCH1627849.1 pro-sigmaK processing inhibitor BofA family protein [Fredinandcohnia sp. SECRCQ15]
MEPIVVISILGGLIVLVLIVGAPLKPIRLVGQLFVKVMIGALLLFFLNAFGTTIDLHVPINFVTATISGLLGLPGIAALVIIDMFIL